MAYTSRRSGRKVRDLLTDAGCCHDECYYTNAVNDPRRTATDRCGTGELPALLLEEVDAIATAVGRPGNTRRSSTGVDGESLDGFLDSVLARAEARR